MNRNFPFTGIAGHDHVKEALLCALVCDTIHSLLIIGSPGTAKSTLVRSVEALVEGKKVITIPQNITYDRLMGTINLELAMKSGSIEFSPGILSQGNNHILYVDDINRMDEGTLQCILTTSQNGQYVLEREGLSRVIISRFTLLASMDPQEGSLSSTHMDLFDLCVRTDRTCDIQTRAEIINRVLFFEQSPDEFICAYEKETEDLKTLLIKARERFPYVTIPEGHLDLITSLCIELGVEGYRGDLALARTAKALAALNQRDEVIFDDIKRAAILTLEHRRHECQSTSQQQSNSHSRDKERESDKK
jgi:magnesium chelatase subunit D